MNILWILATFICSNNTTRYMELYPDMNAAAVMITVPDLLSGEIVEINDKVCYKEIISCKLDNLEVF